jgi:hypothetical protein
VKLYSFILSFKFLTRNSGKSIIEKHSFPTSLSNTVDPGENLYYWFGVGEGTFQIHHLTSHSTPKTKSKSSKNNRQSNHRNAIGLN